MENRSSRETALIVLSKKKGVQITTIEKRSIKPISENLDSDHTIFDGQPNSDTYGFKLAKDSL